MWISYLLLTIVAVQAGQNPVARSVLNQDSQIRLSGNGIIRKNGKTSLNIQVEIGPAGGQVGGAGAGGFPEVGPRRPRIGARRPGGGWRRPGAAAGRPGIGEGRPGAGGGRPGAGAGGPGAGWGRPGAGAGGPGAGTGGPGTGAGGPGAGTGGPGAGEGGPGAETEGPGVEGPGAGIGGPETGEFTDEEKIGLAKHNEFRATHQAPPMTLDRKMCDEAKAYAQVLAQTGSFKHSSSQERHEQGENLSMGCSTNKAQAMETAVINWYNEVCKPGYDFNNGGFSGGTGHFTQVVWKGSTVLGIGRAEVEEKGMKCAYIVGRYDPAGNMGGEFTENVLKGSFDADSYCPTVAKGGRKFFDEQGRPVIIDSPMSAVDVPSEKTGPAEFRRQHVEILNSKKKTIVGNPQE